MREIKLPCVITFRVDDPTKLLIDRAAAARGVAPGILCRDVILREIGAVLELPRVRREVANRDILREVLGEFGRQGSNLNQLARHMNAGTLPAQDLTAMRAAYEAALARLTAALGVGRDP